MLISLDAQQQALTSAFEVMQQGMGGEDTMEQANSFMDWCKQLQETTLAQYKAEQNSKDNAVLAGRGLATLTNAEQAYYSELIEASKSFNPQQSISNISKATPETIIDRIFEDLKGEYKILSLIDSQSVGLTTKVLFHKGARQLATWGELTGEITKELAGDFDALTMGQVKLSAFLPVPIAMLDLGPAWLDRYVRTIFGEAIANGLEKGIVLGAGGEANEPIGMIRDLEGDVTPKVGYPAKEAVAVTKFDPATVGALVATMAKDDNGNPRKVGNLVLIVNSGDYYSKVMPATTLQTPAGGYVGNVMPVPTTIIESEHVPQGKAIFGIGKRYFMGLGSSSAGKLEYSDHYQFLEENRVYKSKVYANGMPKDNNAFLYLDISELKPAVYSVENLGEMTCTVGDINVTCECPPAEVEGDGDDGETPPTGG